MPLRQATATALKLKEALAKEVSRARGERDLLRAMDAASLLRGAAVRAEFNYTAARLQKELADHLGAVARDWGLLEVTLEGLAAFAPEETARLSRAFAEIRALAAALRELDELNQDLAQRTLRCVKGYLSAIALVPQAYDRRGVAIAACEGATRSMRA